MSLRPFGIWLSEYKTGLLTISQITANSLALLRSQQINELVKKFYGPEYLFLFFK
jgi:hypothetical protein